MKQLIEQLLKGQSNTAIANLEHLKHYNTKNMEDIEKSIKFICDILQKSDEKTPEFINGTIILRNDMYDLKDHIWFLFTEATKYAKQSINQYDIDIEANKSMVKNNIAFAELLECAEPSKIVNLLASKKEGCD